MKSLMILTSILTLVFAAKVVAFDTGHHFDLTQSVLSEHGFAQTSVDVAKIENWLVDYYSSSPTSPTDVKRECEKLHFDNLYSTKEVTWYWNRLSNNMLASTKKASEENDKLKMLTIIGVSMHAVQDFYSHSNWVETHPQNRDGGYRTETWWKSGAPSDVSLTTGKYRPYPSPPPASVPEHGGYDSGLNKDSYVRPRWDEAYVFAYCACHEMIKTMEQWANDARPGFWADVKQFSLNSDNQRDLTSDLEAAFRVSLWVETGTDVDGHWKANHSGSTGSFILAAAKFAASSDSIFVDQIKEKRVHELISDGLYASSPPPAGPTFAAFDLQRQAIIVRTTRIEEKDDVGTFERRIDSLGGFADFYANIEIGSQLYVERTLQDKKAFDHPWWTLHFVDASSPNVPIRISVMDEDDGDDDACDICPAVGERALALQFNTGNDELSGDVTGIHNSAATAITQAGKKPDKDRAVIKFYVTHKPLAAD